MQSIEREELKQKIGRGDEFVLLETASEEAYRRAHLPGAINLSDLDQVSTLLPDKSAEIVTYCASFT